MKDDEIQRYMVNSGLLWPKHQKIISAHYNVDEVGEAVILKDDSGHENNGEINNGKWIEVILFDWFIDDYFN